MPLFTGINVVSVQVPDLLAAREFYANVLGFGPPAYDLPDDGWIEFVGAGGGGNIAITPADPDWRPSTAVTLVLNTADCYQARAELLSRGVRCDEPEVFPGYVVFANFYDPFGNRLQMCSPAPE